MICLVCLKELAMRNDNRAVRLEDGILLQEFICIKTIHFASRLLGTGVG